MAFELEQSRSFNGVAQHIVVVPGAVTPSQHCDVTVIAAAVEVYQQRTRVRQHGVLRARHFAPFPCAVSFETGDTVAGRAGELTFASLRGRPCWNAHHVHRGQRQYQQASVYCLLCGWQAANAARIPNP